MLKVEIIDHHMDINPQGLEVEDLEVVQLRLAEGTDALKVHISANGFFYNPERNKYVKY